MNDQPNVGDLAEIIHHPCCAQRYIGRTILVTQFAPLPVYRNRASFNGKHWQCRFCKSVSERPVTLACVDQTAPENNPDRIRWYPRSWLRKLPPIKDDEAEPLSISMANGSTFIFKGKGSPIISLW